MEPSAPLYPVVLRVDGRRCLVVGGGPVAARKAAGLLACGAAVTLVAPDLHPSIETLRTSTGPAGAERGTLTVLERRYRPGEAGEFRLVVTATGVRAVDAAVAADAEAAGVWVNSADDVEHCSFLLPSVHRDGPVTVAVSTSGTSPALATWVRRRIGAMVGTDLGVLAELLQAARRRLKAEGHTTGSIDWQAVLDGPLPDLVRDGHLDAANALLAGELPIGERSGLGHHQDHGD